MSIRDLSVTAFVSIFVTASIFLSFRIVGAQVMQSTNYRIQSDSVNFGGGLSTSTNYGLESSAGEIATGDLSGTNYNLKAGYQQMITAFISMSTPSNITMSPAIVGVSGGTADGATTVTVTTDSAAGYQMTIAAALSPAMQKGIDTIADYTPAGADPDFSFTTDSTDSHLGYSPSGVDVAQRFKDDGATCNTGSSETALACWDGLDTAAAVIVNRSSANTPNGSVTTINFRVGVGGSVVQTAGVYTATTTLTAIAL